MLNFYGSFFTLIPNVTIVVHFCTKDCALIVLRHLGHLREAMHYGTETGEEH